MNNIQIGNYTVVDGSNVIINGRKVEVPKHVGRFGSNTTIINNKVFINGYELKSDGSCKKTLRAIWHQIL